MQVISGTYLRGSFSRRVLAKRDLKVATSSVSPSTGSASSVVVAMDCSLYASSLIRFIPKGSAAPSALFPKNAPKARSMKSGLSPEPRDLQMTLLGGVKADRKGVATLGLLGHAANGNEQACPCSRDAMALTEIATNVSNLSPSCRPGHFWDPQVFKAWCSFLP